MNTDSVDNLLQMWERERPDLDVWPSAIAARIYRLAMHLRRHSESWLKRMGLSWETFEIIVALRRNGTPFEMKPTELYKATFLTSGAMTNRLDRAQEAGLIIRVPDPDDRRGLLIRLTPAGKCLGDAAFERYNKEIHQLMGHLALEQRTEVVNLLRTLLSPFETSPTEDKGNRAS